jgi:energy-coupling factor transporter transmembrane protein EcfT
MRRPAGPSPRVRLLSLVGLVVIVAALPPTMPWLAISAAVALVVAVVAFAGVQGRGPALRRLAAGVTLAALALVPMALSLGPGAAAPRLLRAVFCLTIALSMGATLSRSELVRALESLRVPRTLTQTVRVLLHTLASLERVGKGLVLARKLRGGSSFGSLLSVIPGLFLASATRAEKVDLAMSLRGS